MYRRSRRTTPKPDEPETPDAAWADGIMAWLRIGPYKRLAPWKHWLALWVTLAILIVIAVTYPWTKTQCYEWAVGQRHDGATRVAYRICEQRFGDLDDD